MTRYRSEVIGPPQFWEQPDKHQVKTLKEIIPYKWQYGEKDSVESLGEILGQTRDHHLYRKVGSESWEAYCCDFLSSPAAAFDELIEGVRILKGRDPARTGIHADEARAEARRKAVAKAREDAKRADSNKKSGKKIARIPRMKRRLGVRLR